MENWQLALVMMAALLAGAVIPLLFQLRSTLRVIKEKVSSVEQALQPTLEDARIAAHRMRLVTDGIEGDEASLGRNLNQIADSASELATTLQGLGNSAKVATAVGSAVAAGVRAFREAPRHVQAQPSHPEHQQEQTAKSFYPPPSSVPPSVNRAEV